MTGAVALFLLCGIATVGSIAGYGLTVLAALAGFLVYRKAAYGSVGVAWGGAMAMLFAVFIGLALFGPLNSERLSEEVSGEPTSRAYFARTTMKAVKASFPVGTGLGTFQEIYRTFDDPFRVSHEYTNHAHNDYLELVLELGLAGALLILAFLIWFAARSIAVWRATFEGTGLARAGSVIILILLLHSVVDYPLRTSAIGVLFAFACALLVPYAKPRSAPPSEASGGGLRHLKAD
jgi:O-antigen ligase